MCVRSVIFISFISIGCVNIRKVSFNNIIDIDVIDFDNELMSLTLDFYIGTKLRD